MTKSQNLVYGIKCLQKNKLTYVVSD